MLEVWIDPWGSEDCCRFRLYEHVKRSEVNIWKYMGNLGKRGSYRYSFPKIIESIETEKFILFPQETKLPRTTLNMTSVYHMELWEKNNIWSRSTLKFSVDLQDDIQHLWIMQM